MTVAWVAYATNIYFSQFWRLEVWDQGTSRFLVPRWQSAVHHMAEREGAGCFVCLHVRALIPSTGLPPHGLMTSQRRISKYHHLKIRILTYEWEGRGHRCSGHSILFVRTISEIENCTYPACNECGMFQGDSLQLSKGVSNYPLAYTIPFI